jgi:hypothetical protein
MYLFLIKKKRRKKQEEKGWLGKHHKKGEKV